jgi:hypothetical protein
MVLPAFKKFYYKYIKNLDEIEKDKLDSKSDTCGIVVNYKTPDLIKKYLSNFREYFSNLHLVIVDNSNYDRSTDLIYSICKRDGNMTLLANVFNIHHGPGLHKAIQYVEDYFEFALIMDSDILFHKKGIIDDMKKILTEKFMFCGKIVQVSVRGMNSKEEESIPYIHPSCMYININEYLQLPPAKLHGAPFIDTFSSVKEQDKQNLLIDFEVSNYMTHLGRGTVIRTGGYHTKNHPLYAGNKKL